MSSITVKICFQPNMRTLSELLEILRNIYGNVWISKVGCERNATSSILGLYSLGLHCFDSICITTDNDETDLRNIKRRVEMIS
ncbi:protein of unknown function [Ruminococcaceae bacterium BL-6]|nr:protein of unknown function [Ruminococcaceae bacterium BL-6]